MSGHNEEFLNHVPLGCKELIIVRLWTDKGKVVLSMH
jgi:hypothetical protein